jgi:hypothetical protein
MTVQFDHVIPLLRICSIEKAREQATDPFGNRIRFSERQAAASVQA